MKIGVTLFLILNLLSYTLYAQDFVFTANLDLNQDDHPDDIILVKTEKINGYKLSINGKEAFGYFDNDETNGFMIVDIDIYDKYKEIAVHTPGPSDDDEYMVYWYNGKEIFLIEHMFGWPVFNGNGIIYLDQWQGFWKSRDKIEVEKTNRTSHVVQQFAYYVGVKATVKSGFTIFRETEKTNKVAMLAKGSEIELLLCDKTNREYFDCMYLIKTASGLTGWADFRTIQENTEGLPYAD